MLGSSERLLADDRSGRLVIDVKISGRTLQEVGGEVGKVPAREQGQRSNHRDLNVHRESVERDIFMDRYIPAYNGFSESKFI